MSSQVAVSLRGVGTEFYNPKLKRRVRVLDDINLDVLSREILCVVGPSGCGKSTLLAGIGGFRPFSTGVCLIDGKQASEPNRDRGVVFQDYPILDFLTAVENVAIGLHFESFCLLENLLPWTRHKRSKKNIEVAMEYLAYVGLVEHANKFPKELSGGQKQRVAIAQAIAMKPRVLLMDEPFSGLDPDTREKLQLVVLKVHRELDNTIFFVTHDLEEAVFLGNMLVVLSQFSPGRSPESGATIVHEQRLEEYKSAEAKSSAGFGQLIREIRSKFHYEKGAT